MDNSAKILNFLDSQFGLQENPKMHTGIPDVDNFILAESAEYDILQTNEINRGLSEGIDVSFYRNPQYDFLQMEQIRIGLQEGCDVSVYANPKYSHSIMREIRLGLAEGFNLCPYTEVISDGNILEQLKLALVHGVDIMPYIKEGYDDSQLEEIRISLECGINIKPYLSKKYFSAQLHEIRIGLLNKVDVHKYANSEYNWMQMQEIRLGLEEHLDITHYARPLVNFEQMQEIRYGLEQNVDVTKYKSLMNISIEMKKKRIALFALKEQEEIDSDVKEFKNTNKEFLNGASITSYDDVIDDSNIRGEVYVAPNLLSATLTLQKPGPSSDYSIDKITEFIMSYGVTQGILKDIINQMLTDNIYDRPIVIARGKAAVNGNDGYYDFHFPLKSPTAPKVLTDGSVDYHDMHLFNMVEKDEFIAEYHSSTSGTFGYKLDGSIIIPKKGKERPALHGHGFYMDNDTRKYYASFSGKIELADNYNIIVDKVLAINGNVDVSTGNIDFDGNIIIKGDVISGYSVRATGNISVEGHAESVSITAGNDIIVKKGVQGNNTGVLIAGGNIYGSYFEAVTIKCNGNLNANYLLNTNVKCFAKTILSGRNGAIIGGRVVATDGISVYTIGNPSMIKTHVQVGITSDISDRFRYISNGIERIRSEINLLQNGRIKILAIGCINDRLQEMLDKIDIAEEMKNEEIENLNNEREALAHQINNTSNSTINVKGITYIGTTVTVQMRNVIPRINTRNVTFNCFDNNHVAVIQN